MATKFEVPVGTRFGKWTTTSEKYKPENKKHYHLDVRCDCGETLTILAAMLTTGRATRCWRCYNGTRPTHLSPRDVVVNKTLLNYKKSARKRGLDFQLTREEFEELLFADCYYCGSPPRNRTTDRAAHTRVLPRYGGLDRTDNSVGYLSMNVVPCCRWCNEAKKAKTSIDFESWIKGLTENYHRRNGA